MSLDLLRRQYQKDTAALVTTSACVALGHPPKHPISPEHKQDWERGCCCGARDDI